MDNPLTGDNIKGFFNGKCKVITYEDLSSYNTIEELLHPYGKCVILYVWARKPNPFGHWQTVFKNKNGNYEVFDSYGSWIDSFLDKIDKQFRIDNGEMYKYLTKLLYDGNKSVEYNDKKLQDDNSNTCGKWCVYRMLRDDLNIDEFNNLFTDNTKINDKIILKIFSN